LVTVAIALLQLWHVVDMEGGPPMKCRNYQELKIQEQVQRLAVGTIPRSIWVVLMDDLVDMCKAGDDVTIWSVWLCHR